MDLVWSSFSSTPAFSIFRSRMIDWLIPDELTVVESSALGLAWLAFPVTGRVPCQSCQDLISYPLRRWTKHSFFWGNISDIVTSRLNCPVPSPTISTTWSTLGRWRTAYLGKHLLLFCPSIFVRLFSLFSCYRSSLGRVVYILLGLLSGSTLLYLSYNFQNLFCDEHTIIYLIITTLFL